MSEVELNVSREEYAARIAKARCSMEARGIELLIVSDPSNMAWLTGGKTERALISCGLDMSLHIN